MNEREGAPAPLSNPDRSALYTAFGALLDQLPTPKFLQQLERGGFLARLGIRLDPETDADRLAEEQTRLFVGPGPALPPYGSVHRADDDRAGELWGATTAEVRRFMKAHGLEPSQPGYIPDHLSILFGVMSRLIEAGMEAEEEGSPEGLESAEALQRRFFQDFIEPWSARFLERVSQESREPFYARVAEAAIEFLKAEGLRFQTEV